MSTVWKVLQTIFWVVITLVLFPIICYIAGDALGDRAADRLLKIWGDDNDTDIAETIAEKVFESVDELAD